ncbi:hypothetical protein D1007_00425 [Hordeum vulgare]|nr:hypothetical protein D1007_00425 [Hordeum vulgare]
MSPSYYIPRRRSGRPRGWIALCDGGVVRPDDACEIIFFHTRTAKRLRVPLPELRQHRIVGFTDGLVILMHNLTTTVRVLHPFTHDAVDFPPLVTIYCQVVGHKASVLDINVAVCSSASSAESIVVVVWFPCTNVMLAADLGSPDWEVLHSELSVLCALPFQGRLYDTLSGSSHIVQLYPLRREGPLENSVLIADAPHSAHINLFVFTSWSLVEGCCSQSGSQLIMQMGQNGMRWTSRDK